MTSSCYAKNKLYQVDDNLVSCETPVDDLGVEAGGEANSIFSTNNNDDQNESYGMKPKFRLCLSTPCRTKWQTGSLTLKCHNCESGWLMNHRGDAYACHGCLKEFASLKFIVSQTDELLKLAQFWYDDLRAKADHPRSSLAMMKTYYNSLVETFLAPGNIRIVQLTFNMATACHLVGDHLDALEYNHRVMRILLDYDFRFVADRSKLKCYLEQIVEIATSHTHSLLPEEYIDAVELLSERIRLLYD